MVSTTQNQRLSLAEVKTLITRRWPSSWYAESDWSQLSFSTGFRKLDALFPGNGIPYGQLIEITGDISSGKTSLLFAMLSQITQKGVVAYMDFGHSFFPSSAAACGVNMARVIILQPDSPTTGLRAAELLFRHHLVCGVVFDLVGERSALPITLLHRLRLQTVRAKALIMFLTESDAANIPASTTSLKLEVHRFNGSALRIAVVKSRISTEGSLVEVKLHD
jgi:recombination protein RecA